MKVEKIYLGIEHIGKRQGQFTTYIICDNSGNEISQQDIVNKVLELNCENVTITGSEPLLQEGIDSLISALCESNKLVNIVTNGSQKIWQAIPSYNEHRNAFVTVVYDCKYDKLNIENVNECWQTDCFVFEFENQNHLDEIIKFLYGLETYLNFEYTPHIYLINICDTDIYSISESAKYLLSKGFIKTVQFQNLLEVSCE